ncbi:hypothetical protein HRbin40_01976 [bacterium HR40]|nr:hypothetical protein HRbin40_01976 [bacterium HR40]
MNLRPPLLCPAVLVVLLSACAGWLPLEVEGDAGAARVQLEAAAASGPVALSVRDAPAEFPPERVAKALAEGVVGLEAQFEPTSRVRPASALLSFAPAEPDSLCRGESATAPPASPTLLLLVWCGDGEAVAAVTVPLASTAPQEVERAIWRAARRLFPDRYAERYGIDLFGLRVGVGASIGF